MTDPEEAAQLSVTEEVEATAATSPVGAEPAASEMRRR
jgi:hypothetical protein